MSHLRIFGYSFDKIQKQTGNSRLILEVLHINTCNENSNERNFANILLYSTYLTFKFDTEVRTKESIKIQSEHFKV